MDLETDDQSVLEELEKAIRIVQRHGFTVLDGPFRITEQEHFAKIQFELDIIKRRRNLKRQKSVGDSGGRAGRPLSLERTTARKYALAGTPYVMALTIAKGLAEQFSATPDYRKLKQAFDREYRQHGVNPPAAPLGWSRYSLEDTDQAGWPPGWESRWGPDLICWICGSKITGEYRRALMNGKYGIEWYPVHSECGEKAASTSG
jgi:hypothetical protein